MTAPHVAVFAQIGPRALFAVTAGIVLLLVLPLALLSIVGAARHRRRHSFRAKTFREITELSTACLECADRNAARIVRAALDDPSSRDIALRAVSVVVSRHDVNEAEQLRRLVLDSSAADWLERELGTSASDRVVRALELIGELGLGGPFVPHLVLLLDDERADVRRAAAVALTRVDPLIAAARLPARLGIDGPWVADCLVDALSASGANSLLRTRPSVLRHVPNLVIDLRDNADTEDAYTAALMALVSAPSEPLRLAAIAMLGASGSTAAVSYLYGALQSSDPLLRSAAAGALARHRNGLALLRSVAEDTSNAASLTARSVLWALDSQSDAAETQRASTTSTTEPAF